MSIYKSLAVFSLVLVVVVKGVKQAGAELGQAQLKLELDLTLIFFRFGFIELTGWYSCS